MANDAAKKAAVKAIALRDLYTKIMLGIYILYIVVRMIWKQDTFGILNWIGIGFLSLVNYICLSSIFAAAEQNVGFEYYQDILFVNWFVQVTTVFSDWFWLAYLSVPAYVLWRWGPMLKGFLESSKGEEGDQNLSAKEQKKRDKKERQQGRVKYQRAR